MFTRPARRLQIIIVGPGEGPGDAVAQLRRPEDPAVAAPGEREPLDLAEVAHRQGQEQSPAGVSLDRLARFQVRSRT